MNADELEALANAAVPAVGAPHEAVAAFHRAATPLTVAELIADLRRAQETIDAIRQAWEKRTGWRDFGMDAWDAVLVYDYLATRRRSMTTDELIERVRAIRDDAYLSATYLADEHLGDLMGEILAVFEQVQPEPEWEYRIDDGKTFSYTRTRSRVDRALQAGHRVLRRVPERRASAWEPVEVTE